MKKETKDHEENPASGITRKDAIKKMGKYAALSAIGTFLILDPKKAQAQSASPNPGGNSGDGSGNGSGSGNDSPPNPPGWDD